MLCSGKQARLWLQILRFALVGLVNTGFGYAAFAVLILMGAGLLAALILAAFAGMAFNFQTSRRLVFYDGGPGRIVRFTVLYAVVLGLNWAALQVAAQLGLPSLKAQALLAVPVAAISFLGQRFLVFAPAAQQA